MEKFHVIIPTRDRSDTLAWTLKTCLAQDYENLSILVSDNCSVDQTADLVASIRDPRVSYVRTPERMSMSEHWDWVLQKVSGGFVCIIGDDDGLAPGALKHVDALIRNYKVDAVSSRDKAIYYWPAYIENSRRGLLQLSLNNTFRIKSVKQSMNQSLKALRMIDLPQLYHGFIRTDLLKSIPRFNGVFFKGSSPDIYASVLLGAVLGKQLLSNYPFTIHGLSHHSIGSSFAMKHLNPEAAEKFIRENKALSHPQIVICGSTTAIFSDALLHAHDQLPSIPAPDMKKVLQFAIREAVAQGVPEAYTEVVNAMKETARINHLEPEFEQLLERHPFAIRPASTAFVPNGYVEAQETLYLSTMEWKAENVYDAFLLLNSLLSKAPVDYEQSIPRVAVGDFIRRKIRYHLRKFSGTK